MIRATLGSTVKVGRKWTHVVVEMETPEDWFTDEGCGNRGPVPIFHRTASGKFVIGFKYLNQHGLETL
jgi:hypothetical protein